MEGPRPSSKTGRRNRKSGKRKGARSAIDRAPGIGRMSGGQSLLLIATKGAAERTVLHVLRRVVEDATGFCRLGSVEAAAERAGEGTTASRRYMPVAGTLVVPENVLPAMSPVRVARSVRVAVISPVSKSAVQRSGVVLLREILPLPSIRLHAQLATQLPL